MQEGIQRLDFYSPMKTIRLPKIRLAKASDARPLAEFGARTFDETFGSSNTPEDMEAYLSKNYNPEQQLTEILDPNVITLIAEWDGNIVAFSQFRLNPMANRSLGEIPVELWRFYLDRSWQGSGFAHVLMDHTLEAASQLGRSIWLSVWEENIRAIKFYKKCGFIDIGKKDFWLGQDKQTDRVLMMHLKEHL
jgi:ribosomal protein S18 acetylase RimI-like enzyme